MASAAEEEVDYESDPEELKRSLRMRRREASDDEGEIDGGEKMGMDRRAWIHSDELDGQGGVAEYDDDNEELDAEDVEEEEEADEEQVEKYEVNEHRGGGARGSYRGVVDDVTIMRKELEGDGKLLLAAHTNNRTEQEEEEKDKEEKGENEPFAVPTAGAFYMHDDRFRDKNGGRNRRMRGGRHLWESKDQRKWGHDKFEELSLQEKHKEEGIRTSKSRYRGQGKIQGTDGGNARGNTFRDKEYNFNNNQNHAPKSVKGRGPKRYEPMAKNSSHDPSSQSKFGKHSEKVSYNSAEKSFASSLIAEAEIVAARRQVFASSLNSASPPFYPSGSSNKGIAITQNKNVQTSVANKNLESFSMPETTSLMRGKAIAEPGGNDTLYKDDSVKNPPRGKPLMNVATSLARSSVVNYSQPTQSKTQGRGHMTTSTSYQPSHPSNQGNRISSLNQLHGVQQSLAHSGVRIQHVMHASSQQLGQHLSGRSHTSSPPKESLSIISFEGKVGSPSELTTSRSALVGKGKVGSQGNGRGSFLYGSSQVTATGSMNVSSGEPNFPATPTFLPVMQFGGQHPNGIGVPAVGMAFPGYVAQPKLSLGNSEMTWLPVLAGAAGPLGAQYCSSYIAVDGSFHSHPPGQISLVGTSSKDNTTNRPNNEWKPSKRSELAKNEFGQRQNKPRRSVVSSENGRACFLILRDEHWAVKYLRQAAYSNSTN